MFLLSLKFTPPLKAVMLAAFLSSFLGFLFSVGQLDALTRRRVQQGELIPTTEKSSMHCKKGYRFSIPQATDQTLPSRE